MRGAGARRRRARTRPAGARGARSRPPCARWRDARGRARPPRAGHPRARRRRSSRSRCRNRGRTEAAPAAARRAAPAGPRSGARRSRPVRLCSAQRAKPTATPNPPPSSWRKPPPRCRNGRTRPPRRALQARRRAAQVPVAEDHGAARTRAVEHGAGRRGHRGALAAAATRAHDLGAGGAGAPAVASWDPLSATTIRACPKMTRSASTVAPIRSSSSLAATTVTRACGASGPGATAGIVPRGPFFGPLRPGREN